jgi:FkbM family methyltransferase
MFLKLLHKYSYTIHLRACILRELALAKTNNRFIPSNLRSRAIKEPHIVETYIWFLRFFDNNEAVSLIDIGGNSGYWSQGFRELFPKGDLLAFEPVTDMYKKYKERYNNDDTVQVVHSAVSDTNGTMEINVAKDYGLTSFNQYGEDLKELNEQFARKEEVKISTLDSFGTEIAKLKGKKVVKIDIQGWEAFAVKGGLKSLTNVDAIVIECSMLNEFKDAFPTFPELTSLLYPIGFSPILFGVADMQKAPVGYERDVLFIKNELLPKAWGY